MTPIKPLLDYKKYRWFFTSTNKLVVGGKSSSQNDELLKILKRSRKDYVTMHTSEPGSPFAIIIEEIEKVKKADLEETAVFTGCFSRAWREMKTKVSIDIFTLSQLYKSPKMKVGTWGIRGIVKKKSVTLELSLTKQDGRLRAVPASTAKKKETFLKIKPGRIDKREMLPKLQVEISEQMNQEELLSSLPPGGIAIVRK